MSANKRRKVSSTGREETARCERRLDTLPPEVLETILRFLPFEDVAASVRLVSRYCSAVSTTLLNNAFLSFRPRLDRLVERLESSVESSTSNLQLLGCCRALCALKMIRTQYNMLEAVTWRYTRPPLQQDFPRLCFYAGGLLDSLEVLLREETRGPSVLAVTGFVSKGMARFLALCKRFMNFFEKVSERRLNGCPRVSGCKVVDLLDCLLEGRQVLSLKTSRKKPTGGSVDMKVRYVMKCAWFTCLQVQKTEESCWRDEQRFMYLRLRRLVCSVNEHLLENLFYEYSLLQTFSAPLPLAPPPASTYSGYGEYDGRFFYYGNMNKYAYESKFKSTEASASRFDLVVEVRLTCSLDLAPLSVRRTLRLDGPEDPLPALDRCQRLRLRLDVDCQASRANRLPSVFSWTLQSARAS